MEITSASAPQIVQPMSYSIEALLMKAGVCSQQKMFDRMDGLIRVKGTVTKINRYKSATYLTLKDGEFSISVKCDSALQVYENESILVEGTLYLKPSTFFTGLECCLHGHIVGSWEMTERKAPRHCSPPKKKRFVSLDSAIGDASLASVLLLGTEIGINDVLSQIDSDAVIALARRLSVLVELKAYYGILKKPRPTSFVHLLSSEAATTIRWKYGTIQKSFHFFYNMKNLSTPPWDIVTPELWRINMLMRRSQPLQPSALR